MLFDGRYIKNISHRNRIAAALKFGLEVLKFFPAEAFGGLKSIKAMSGPYTTVKFIPTGGISPNHLSEYLQFPKVLACGGAWIARSDLIAKGKFDTIENNTQEAVGIVKKLKSQNSTKFESCG